jgi:type II secretory ATPase GspE/PulE/Tfp pilus assembly ATPase PilB-like protein
MPDHEPQPATGGVIFMASHADPLLTSPDWHKQAPIERIANSILLCAIRDGASDIDIEPYPTGVLVRYLIQGRWREHLKLPTLVSKPLAAHFKELAHLEENGTAGQWGGFQLIIDEQDYNLAICTRITPHGESIQLRFDGTDS